MGNRDVSIKHTERVSDTLTWFHSSLQSATVRTLLFRYSTRTSFCRTFTVRWPHYDENKPCKLLTTKVHKSQHWMCRWFSKTQTI